MTSLFVLLGGCIMQAFQIQAYTKGANFAAVLLLLFLYCLTSTSLVYTLEKAFDEPSLGQLSILCGNILVGLSTLLLMTMLDALYTIQVNEMNKNAFANFSSGIIFLLLFLRIYLINYLF